MDNPVYYLYENLRSLYPIPESPKEEAYQAFTIGLDFGISLSQELRMFQQEAGE